MKVPRTHDRTNDVVATLDDDGRDVPNLSNVLNQIVVSIEEGIVYEVMAFDPSER